MTERSGSGIRERVGSSDQLKTFRADSGEAEEARFSPDGMRLISYGAAQDLRLWDVTSGKLLVTFAGQRNGEGQAAFMPDGLRFVAASGSRLNVYPATVEQFLVRGCNMLRHRSEFEQLQRCVLRRPAASNWPPAVGRHSLRLVIPNSLPKQSQTPSR